MSANNRVVIDKEVPMMKKGAGRYAKYPFAQMEVGDSFFLQGMEDSRHCSSIVAYWQKKLGHKYTIRIRGQDGKRMTKDGKEGARIYRIR